MPTTQVQVRDLGQDAARVAQAYHGQDVAALTSGIFEALTGLRHHEQTAGGVFEDAELPRLVQALQHAAAEERVTPSEMVRRMVTLLEFKPVSGDFTLALPPIPIP